MSRINLKTDYEDGNVLHGSELNINNNVTMLGVNDNFERINNLRLIKADTTYVDNALSNKVDLSTLNNKIQELNLIKADKTALATKADQTEVDRKANQTYVDNQLATKANQTYVDTQLNTKVNVEDYTVDMNTKADKSVVGDIRNLTTSDKSSVVNAINSIDVAAKSIATIDQVGVVKPDGTTTFVDQDGTIHAVGGGGGQGGVSDYNNLTNKPTINNFEIKGNVTLDDLGLISKNATEDALDTKANVSNVYNKTYIDTNIVGPLANKADSSYVDSQLETKADKETTYTKTAVDQLVEGSKAYADSIAINKVEVGTVYTKGEVDTRVASKADNLSLTNDKLQLMSGTTPIGDEVTLQVSGNEVVIGGEEPTGDDWKLWITDDGIGNTGSEVINSLEGNENNLAPSVRAVNEALSYSTNEIVVGIWIDENGNKIDIYRRIFTVNITSTVTLITILQQNLNVKNVYGTIKYVENKTSGDILQHNIGAYVNDNFYSLVQYNLNTGILKLYSGDSYNGGVATIILEYIKTTD